MSSLRESLRLEHSRGALIPFLGAGVARAVANVPTWAQLIERGLAYLSEVGVSIDQAEVAEEIRRGKLVSAADHIQSALGSPGGEYPAWLRSEFAIDRTRMRNTELLDAIVDLRARLIVTTNYDKLIELRQVFPTDAVTWKEPNKMLSALRDDNPDTQAVLHLHGIYDDPDSVIFGSGDYRRVSESEPYRAIMRALWLGKTLLFVGCSLDGIMDPDFSRLIHWAASTFPASYVKHYMLVDSVSARNLDRRKTLTEYRLQVIDYGGHNDLAAWIRALDAEPDHAIARRYVRIAELARGGALASTPQLASIIEGLGNGPTARPSVDADLKKAFTTRTEARSIARDDLVVLNRAATSVINEDDLNYVNEVWVRGTWTSIDASGRSRFLRAVASAAAALEFYDSSTLAALKRRYINIHENVLSGFAYQFLNRVKRFGLRESEESYTIENLRRIVTSLQAILAADPEATFPNPTRGKNLRSGGRYLLVIRSGRVELRPFSAPKSVEAVLPFDFSPRGFAALKHEGETIVAGADRESIFLWNPLRHDTPSAQRTILEPHGISSTAHFIEGGKIVSLVAAIGGPLYKFIDIGEPEAIVGGPWLTSVTALTPSHVFAISNERTGDILVLTSSGLIPFIDAADLIKYAMANPSFLPDPPEDEFDPSSGNAPSLHHLTLGASHFRGKPVLTADFSVHTPRHVHASFLLLAPDPSPRVVASSVISRRLVFGYCLDDSQNPPRLFATAAYRNNDEENLLRWSRAVGRENGAIFLPEGSIGRPADDLIHVVTTEDGRGFTNDDSGGLFEFSTKEGTFTEVDRDRNARIWDLASAEVD